MLGGKSAFISQKQNTTHQSLLVKKTNPRKYYNFFQPESDIKKPYRKKYCTMPCLQVFYTTEDSPQAIFTTFSTSMDGFIGG